MFSSLASLMGGGDLKETIGSMLEPLIAEHMPQISPIVDEYMAKGTDSGTTDEMIRVLAKFLYPHAPSMVQMMLSEDAFIDAAVEHKDVVLAKLLKARG